MIHYQRHYDSLEAPITCKWINYQFHPMYVSYWCGQMLHIFHIRGTSLSLLQINDGGKLVNTHRKHPEMISSNMLLKTALVDLCISQPCWREALVACSGLSICLNWCWLIINCTTRNMFQWNSILKWNVFINEIHLNISSVNFQHYCISLKVLNTYMDYTSIEWICIQLPPSRLDN